MYVTILTTVRLEKNLILQFIKHSYPPSTQYKRGALANQFFSREYVW